MSGSYVFASDTARHHRHQAICIILAVFGAQHGSVGRYGCDQVLGKKGIIFCVVTGERTGDARRLISDSCGQVISIFASVGLREEENAQN